MKPKYTEILNMRCRDCFEWAITVANKLLNSDIPIRERKEVYEKRLSKEQINTLVLADLKDFGWDEVKETPKEKDMIAMELRGLIQLGLMVDEKTVCYIGKLYPLAKLKIKHVFRKQRESVKQCRPLKDILTD